MSVYPSSVWKSIEEKFCGEKVLPLLLYSDDFKVNDPCGGHQGIGNAYAFVIFQILDMAHRCKVELSGQYIGKFQCKIGYGKATPTTRIWVSGLGPWASVLQLEREFDRFGEIKKIDYIKGDSNGYILYDSINAAQAAVKEMRGFPLGGAEQENSPAEFRPRPTAEYEPYPTEPPEFSGYVPRGFSGRGGSGPWHDRRGSGRNGSGPYGGGCGGAYPDNYVRDEPDWPTISFN
ncbi:hypothetical protein HCN44_004802 [Aphidius gifuensis]|uniref:RRM domain-containing protein n=1 Tax=Aphidius gifuensis TaxID=684658 RepID=A0A834XJ72_APHGI|nr:hypothetical protein HCN44_004802 [Aphidius gifuensis]